MAKRPVVGYAGGTFDMFHVGHVRFLRACKDRCDVLVVALNTDEFAVQYKRKPVMRLAERMEVVGACRYVDRVDVNDGGADSKVSISRNRPQVIFHGDDWAGEGFLKQLGIDEEYLDENGITVEYVPYTKEISTSEIIGRIASV